MKKTKEEVKFILNQKAPKYYNLKSDLENELGLLVDKKRFTIEPKYFSLIVGRVYKNGNRIVSFVNEDTDNKNTKIFEKMKEDMNLIKQSRHIQIRDSKEPEIVFDYFLRFHNPNHPSFKETKKDYVCKCGNVEYKVVYEVLFVQEEGFERSLILEFKTFGHYATPFFSQVKDLEEEIEELIESNEKGFGNTEDGTTMMFHDELGSEETLTFYSINEILSSIVSIRLIELEKTITD